FPVTFHRAFDMVQDPVTALEDIISLGFSRVLTSGGELSALDGLPMIRKLIEQVAVTGGGITERNLQRILEGSGACEFHCSASTSRDSDMQIRNGAVRMGTPFCSSEFSIKVADASRVRTLCSIAKGLL
uniref:Copper homeostasis protein cutC homolog n=1 Tax=Eptatretus burgeri TaxID=7764 RepID=A0A8C4N6V2_EPTBU